MPGGTWEAARHGPAAIAVGDDGHVQGAFRSKFMKNCRGVLLNDRGHVHALFLRRCLKRLDTNYSVTQSVEAKNFAAFTLRASLGSALPYDSNSARAPFVPP